MQKLNKTYIVYIFRQVYHTEWWRGHTDCVSLGGVVRCKTSHSEKSYCSAITSSTVRLHQYPISLMISSSSPRTCTHTHHRSHISMCICECVCVRVYVLMHVIALSALNCEIIFCGRHSGFHSAEVIAHSTHTPLLVCVCVCKCQCNNECVCGNTACRGSSWPLV